MKPALIPLLAAAVLTGIALTARTMTQAVPVSAPTRTPVIVELFTSEGCSSCPPADTLLTQLEKNQPVSGADIIALDEHVDYWNHGGWADRFSSRQFSARQSGYSAALGLDNVYTPQMIVDGRAQFNGSDDAQARAAIARAAKQPKAQVNIEYSSVTDAPSTPDTTNLIVHVSRLPASAKSDPAEVWLAVTEDGLSSSIGGGENAGRHLQHAAVVRQLMALGTVSNDAFNAPISVKLPPGAKRANAHVVVFVQEKNSWRIVGAAEVPFA